MLAFHSGISALRANQASINSIANNIANANTPGYHRQQVQFATNRAFDFQGLRIGTGVHASQIRRAFSASLEDALLQNTNRLASAGEQLNLLSQIETALGPGEGTIHDRLEKFFNDLTELESDPANSNLRGIAIENVKNFAAELNGLDQRLDQLHLSIDLQLGDDVDQAQNLLQEVVDLNRQIRFTTNSPRSFSGNANDLLDQFQQKVTQLSELIDVSVQPSREGGFSFSFGGNYFVDSNSVDIQLDKQPGENRLLVNGVPIQFNGGRIAAYQTLSNTTIPQLKQDYDELARTFAFEIDKIHSTGLPLGGGFESLVGRRHLSDVNASFSGQTSFPVESGELFVSVRDLASDELTLHRVEFDPDVESASDLAAKLSAINGLQAVVPAESGSLTVLSETGFLFDFAGRLQTSPDPSSISGSTVPTISGQYTGQSNEDFRFVFNATGTIGVTEDLKVDVFDQSNNLVGTFDVGQGYAPGSVLETVDGIQVQLSAGDVNLNDEFTVAAVSNSDTTGALAALGLNTLFVGDSAESIAVSADVANDPSRLTLGRNGNESDNSNLQRLARLRDAGLFSGNTSVETFAEEASLGIARRINSLNSEVAGLQVAGQQIKGQIDSVSGVDPNEEAVFLLQYQRAYEASVRVISTIDEVLTELFNII